MYYAFVLVPIAEVAMADESILMVDNGRRDDHGRTASDIARDRGLDDVATIVVEGR